jgi:hypothetical protein
LNSKQKPTFYILHFRVLNASGWVDVQQAVRPVGSFSLLGFMDVSPGVRLDINITENQIFIQQGLSSTPGYVYLTAKEGTKVIIYEQLQYFVEDLILRVFHFQLAHQLLDCRGLEHVLIRRKAS